MRMQLDKSLPKDAAATTEIDSIFAEVAKMVSTLTFDLSPPVLRQCGFRPAVNWLAQNLKDRYGLSVQIKDDGRRFSLYERTELILFRSIRELLLNVVKHAQTHSAIIAIRAVNRTLRTRIEDRGKGFDSLTQSAHIEGGHFGLFSIRERLEYLGGRFSIESKLGQGTRATLVVPVADEKAKARPN